MIVAVGDHIRADGGRRHAIRCVPGVGGEVAAALCDRGQVTASVIGVAGRDAARDLTRQLIEGVVGVVGHHPVDGHRIAVVGGIVGVAGGTLRIFATVVVGFSYQAIGTVEIPSGVATIRVGDACAIASVIQRVHEVVKNVGPRAITIRRAVQLAVDHSFQVVQEF